MMSSTAWCTPYLVILSCRAQSVVWHRTIESPYTVAVPGEWSIGPALHCSHTVAAYPHVL
jgi:hypothetical protein